MVDDGRPPAGGGGADGSDAWFDTSETPRQPPAPPPRGVVYGGDPRGSVYEQLRSGRDDIWPLEHPDQPLAPPPRSTIRPFLVGLVVGIALAAVSIVVFQIFSPDGTPTAVPTSATTSVPVETTLPDTSVPPQATTSTSSTTTTTTTTPVPSTLTSVPADPIEPVGDPLAISDLRLAAGGIGPILIGRPAAEALGRLVASLGPPDGDSGVTVATGAFGACAGEPVRVVRWGPLAAIVTYDADGAGLFSAYRLDLSLGGLDSRAATISTLSGLRAGDTVTDLQRIYADFTIEYVDEPGIGPIFELRQIGETALLIWGPVTSFEDDGLVTGIYSTDACP